MEKVDNLITAIGNLQYSQDYSKLKACKDCLNEIFEDSCKCSNFLFTSNTDKVAFGCYAMPVFGKNEINDALIFGHPQKIMNYMVEVDSKLFDYGMSAEQITQVVLYNIYHLTSGTDPMKRIIDAVNVYFAKTYTSLSIKDSVQYEAILEFGIVDALIQFTNCLYLDSDVVSDPFLEAIELHNFDECLDILYSRIPGCKDESERRPKLNMLEWALRLYTDVKTMRIPALKLLAKGKTVTASSLYIQKMNNVINALNRIDTDSYIQEAVSDYFKKAGQTVKSGVSKVGSGLRNAGGAIANEVKRSGVKAMEDDLYEFKIRAKSAKSKNDKMDLIRNINSNISLLNNLADDTKDASEKKHFHDLVNKYNDLRDNIIEMNDDDNDKSTLTTSNGKSSKYDYSGYEDYDDDDDD